MEGVLTGLIMKKQRSLTDIQLTVLTLKNAGNSNYVISQVLGLHPNTVSKKYADIRKGIAKGSYNNLPENINPNGSLF